MHELGEPRVTRLSVIAMLARLAQTARLPDLGWDRSLGWLTAGDERVRVAVNARSAGSGTAFARWRSSRETSRPRSRGSKRSPARSSTRFGRPAEPLVLERITHLHAQTSTVAGEVSQVATLDAGLIFRRTVDDLPVIGPGGVAMVRIGSDEEVVGGREVCRPIAERGPTHDLRRPEQAVEAPSPAPGVGGIEGEVRVRKAFFGYEEHGSRSPSGVEPAYAFGVEVPGEEADDKAVVVVPALEPAVA